MAITLSDEQLTAVSHIRYFLADDSRQIFTLHGLAGTGKTTVLANIADRYEDVLLCTLTGKAASVLRKKTSLPAMTVHAAFYKLRGEERDKKGKIRPIFKEAHDVLELRNEVLLLDECSMISEKIAADILRTGVKVVACGDPGQLSPVDGVQFFNKPDFTISTIHRQALESPIIRQAHAIRSGANYGEDGENFRVCRPGQLSEQDKRDADIVLCWTNKTRQAVNRHMREIRGFSMMPHPQVGEPVLCLKNAPDYGIFNGGLYDLLEPFYEGDTTIKLNVDGVAVEVPNVNFHGLKSGLPNNTDVTTYFDFGYALTVHKAQGSEWDKVILIDEYRRQEDRQKWLYTGITRAAEKITIIRA
jgi:exodeoxyribonuclease-5